MPELTHEFKRLPQYVKVIDGNTVEGIFSVAGVLDSYNDITNTGAFAKTISERGGKVLHLWQHDFYSLPTAKVEELREISRGELPELVQVKFPEATGGALVRRTYIEGSPRAAEVLAVIKQGVPLEMSFGYDAIKFEFEEDAEKGLIRYLNEIRLWETSDVLWGANPATQVSKQRPSIPLDTLLGQLDAYLTTMKAGRRNAQSDLSRINEIAILAYELGATTVKLAEADDDEDGGEGKSVLPEIVDDIIETTEPQEPQETAEGDKPEQDTITVITEPAEEGKADEDVEPESSKAEADEGSAAEADEDTEEAEEESDDELDEDGADEDKAEPDDEPLTLELLFAQVDIDLLDLNT